MIFGWLGDIPLGSDVLTGPTGSDEQLDNTINEHPVVSGKPVPQRAGEELDRRRFTFFFDETFCDPEAEYAKLKAARSSGSILPLVFGNGGYGGEQYEVKSVRIRHRKTTASGRVVRIDASVDLLEVPRGAITLYSAASGLSSLIGSGVAAVARAVINPLVRK